MIIAIGTWRVYKKLWLVIIAVAGICITLLSGFMTNVPDVPPDYIPLPTPKATMEPVPEPVPEPPVPEPVPEPQPEEIYIPIHQRFFYDATNSSNCVVLTITWVGGSNDGRISLFKSAANSNVWYIQGIRDYYPRLVEPTFGIRSDAATISFPPTRTTRVYNLFSDGTGFFAYPSGAGRENLTWESLVN